MSTNRQPVSPGRGVARLHLAHTPTPLVPLRCLAELAPEVPAADLPEVFVKRDDMTGGPEAGNKIRKLEYLLAEAEARGADTLITCGGIQSNHARATAIVGAQRRMRTILLLRTTDPELDPKNAPHSGNVLLDRLVGAEIRLITPAQYRERAAAMADVAAEVARSGRVPYVIPEGGSSGLGSLGYVRAMEEIRRQLDVGIAGGRNFDVIVHACGSGGTAAGVALGAAQHGVASEVWPMAVCDDRAYFTATIERIIAESRALDPSLAPPVPALVDDSAKGPAYGVSTDEQKALILEVARRAGLLLDPVYTGKAFFGLVAAVKRGALNGKRVLFLHTGGLPGLLAQAHEFPR